MTRLGMILKVLIELANMIKVKHLWPIVTYFYVFYTFMLTFFFSYLSSGGVSSKEWMNLL